MTHQQTPGVQTVLGAAGACPEICSGGRVWKIGHPTGKAKSTLEEFAASTAVDEVLALEAVLPVEAFEKMWSDTLGAIQAKSFRTWGDGWKRVVFDPQNSHLFLLALLREKHPDATEADAKQLYAAEPERVAAALARVVPGFFSVLLEGRPLTAEQRAAVDAIRETLLANLSPGPEPLTATTP